MNIMFKKYTLGADKVRFNSWEVGNGDFFTVMTFGEYIKTLQLLKRFVPDEGEVLTIVMHGGHEIQVEGEIVVHELESETRVWAYALEYKVHGLDHSFALNAVDVEEIK